MVPSSKEGLAKKLGVMHTRVDVGVGTTSVDVVVAAMVEELADVEVTSVKVLEEVEVISADIEEMAAELIEDVADSAKVVVDEESADDKSSENVVVLG